MDRLGRRTPRARRRPRRRLLGRGRRAVPVRRLRRRPDAPARRWCSRPRCCSRPSASRPPTPTGSSSAQSDTGAVLIVGLPDGTRRRRPRRRLRGARATSDPTRTTGVWNGGEELVARISASNGSSLTPQLQYVALDADRHLRAGQRQRAATCGRPSASSDDDLDDEGLRDVADGGGRAAVGRRLHRRLRLQRAGHGPGRRRRPEHRRPAGRRRPARVDPMTGFAMAVEPDRQVTVAMAFETDDQARTQRRQPRDARRRTRARPGRRLQRAVHARPGHRRRRRRAHGAGARRRQPRALRPLDRAGAVRDLLRAACQTTLRTWPTASRSRCHHRCLGMPGGNPSPRDRTPLEGVVLAPGTRLSGSGAAAGCWSPRTTDGERHRGAGDHRVEQAGGGERQRGDVVGERPEQVALDRRAGCAATSRIASAATPQVAADQGQVARLDRRRRCRCPWRGRGRPGPARRRR